jgi:hypothetical protein
MLWKRVRCRRRIAWNWIVTKTGQRHFCAATLNVNAANGWIACGCVACAAGARTERDSTLCVRVSATTGAILSRARARPVKTTAGAIAMADS